MVPAGGVDVIGAAATAKLGMINLPSPLRLTSFAVLSILLPYAYGRLQRAHAAYALREAAACRREAFGSARRNRHDRRGNIHESTIKYQRSRLSAFLSRALFSASQLGQHAQKRFWSLVGACLEPSSRVTALATFLHQLHRMIFFLRQDYSTVGMRLSGIRQIFNRDMDEGRVSYSVLGMLLFVRLILGTSRELLSAWALLQSSSMFKRFHSDYRGGKWTRQRRKCLLRRHGVLMHLSLHGKRQKQKSKDMRHTPPKVARL